MEVHDKLDELTAYVEGARAMPMSASCILNRAEVLALLDDVRDLLPVELHRAEELLLERDQVLARAREDAERIREEAVAERARLVSTSDVLEEAQDRARQLHRETEAETERMRRETEDYVVRKIEDFEVVLGKTLAAMQRGREKLLDRQQAEQSRPADRRGPVGRDPDEFGTSTGLG